MTCGCSGNKNTEELNQKQQLNQSNQPIQTDNQLNYNHPKLSLEYIKNKSIDEIIELYQQGYRF